MEEKRLVSSVLEICLNLPINVTILAKKILLAFKNEAANVLATGLSIQMTSGHRIKHCIDSRDN